MITVPPESAGASHCIVIESLELVYLARLTGSVGMTAAMKAADAFDAAPSPIAFFDTT